MKNLDDRFGKRSDYRPMVTYCPMCGNELNKPESFVTEYWEGRETIYFCWCRCCGWRGEIKDVKQVIASEIGE